MGLIFKKLIMRAGVSFSPLDISGLQLWLDGSDQSTLFQDSAKTTPVTADGDVTGAMVDKSGNGNDVLQATTANKPLYKTGIQNGLSVVRFDGIDDYLAATFVLNQPEHVFVVENNVTFTDADRIFDGNTLNSMSCLQNGVTDVRIYAGATVLTSMSTVAFNALSLVFDGASSDIRVDNNAPVTGNVGADNAGGITICASGNKISSFGNIEIAEFLVYNVELVDANLANVQNYLNNKWAVY